MSVSTSIIEEMSLMLSTISEAQIYNKKPPSGPPTEYPTLSSEELDLARKTADGHLLGVEAAYSKITLMEDQLAPIDVDLPSPESLDGEFIWGIDGSNKSLDYSAFHILIARAAIVEFEYSKEKQLTYHEIKKIDMSGVCMVDQNIFDDDVYLFGNSPKKNTSKNISWIDILENNSSLVVGFDPSTTDNKPSSHAQGWCVKLMHTGELMALTKIPEKKSGVVVRDGPLLPVAATMKDTVRAMKVVLNWENKHLMSVSKRIQESTLFVEFLTNPSNEKNMEYYFPDQSVSSDILSKLPADYLLLPKILKPGQRTPFLEAIPKNRAPIPKKHPQLSPISCYYMRKRKPHNIIRIEFPRIYLDDENLERLNWSLGFVAWQHEIGASVPMIQEAADSQCQVKAEVSILQNVARSELSKKGLGTLEVYE